MKNNNALIIYEKIKNNVDLLHIGILDRNEKFVYNNYANYSFCDLLVVLYEKFHMHEIENIYTITQVREIREGLIDMGRILGLIESVSGELKIVYNELRKEKVWSLVKEIKWEDKEKIIYKKLKELQNHK